MDDSDSSSLSSAPEEEVQKLAPIFVKAKKATKQAFPPPAVSPPRPKRPPSPPHEETLADNPDIATIVMFRSRFDEAFPSKLPQFGPQDIEFGVQDSLPTPQIESLLCALLALVLNRKKPVERGHHTRALEEAVASQKSQWPHGWNGVNPLHGPRDFNIMTPSERLNLLRTLIMWSMTSSDAIQGMMKEKYKQNRHNDDENQPLSVQPWGNDGDKRRYFLVQGLDDTGFRVYREGSRYTKNAHWYNVAGNIEEVKTLAAKLEEEDGTQAARRLAGKINNAIPTFEATEEKRRRREYRQMRRAQFARPEPGLSLYEGRTRGRRFHYNFEDDDAFDDSDDTSARRSARHSARNTPFDSGPEFTASGRQIKRPRVGEYGESLLSTNVMTTDELAPDYEEPVRGGSDESDPVTRGGRAMRSAAKPSTNGATNPRKRKHIDGYNNIDAMSEEDDATPSADEWNSDANEAEDEDMPDADDEDEGSDDEEDQDDKQGEAQTLVVKLRVSPKAEKHETPLPDTAPRKAELIQNGDPSGSSTDLSCGAVAATTPPSISSAYPTPASTSVPSAERKHVSAISSDQVAAAEQIVSTEHINRPAPALVAEGMRTDGA